MCIKINVQAEKNWGVGERKGMHLWSTHYVTANMLVHFSTQFLNEKKN